MWLDVAAVALGTSVFLWHFTIRPMFAEAVRLSPVAHIGATLLLGGVTAVFVVGEAGLRRAHLVDRADSLLLRGCALAVGRCGPEPAAAALRRRVPRRQPAADRPLGCFLVALGAYRSGRAVAGAGAGRPHRGSRRFSLLPVRRHRRDRPAAAGDACRHLGPRPDDRDGDRGRPDGHRWSYPSDRRAARERAAARAAARRHAGAARARAAVPLARPELLRRRHDQPAGRRRSTT